MQIWSLLRRLLSILAVAGLIAWPFAVPAAAETTRDGATAAMTDDMHCPNDQPMAPDCHKSCPLMTLCVTKVLQDFPVPSAPRFASQRLLDVIVPHDDAERNGVTEAPLPRPPRS